MAGAREGRDCKGRSVPDKVVPAVLGRFTRRGGLQLATWGMSSFRAGSIVQWVGNEDEGDERGTKGKG